MPHLPHFSLAFKHIPRLLPALISHSPGASRLVSSQGKDQVVQGQVWMGLVRHLPPQKFALELLAKVGLKPLCCRAASLSSSIVFWTSQRTMENLWVCWPCSPSFIRVVSSLRCFKLSTQRTSAMREGYLTAATYVPLYFPHLLSFLPSSETV